jgi:chitinase
MKLMLDENVTPRLREILIPMGYNVECAQSLKILGASDNYVFEEARKQGRALITHNGKHFVIQIPPKMPEVTHNGLIWAKYQITRGNAEVICNELHKFFSDGLSLDDSIWAIKKVRSEIQFQKIYPLN